MESIESIASRVPIGTGAVMPDDGKAARKVFKDAMDHLAAAYRHELTDEAIRVYWHALQDIPETTRHAGMGRCARTLKFFPTVAELRTACADLVDERRASVAVRAKQIQDDCTQCIHARGWMPVTVNGVATVDRCDCWRRAKALLDSADEPLARPALPARDGNPAA